jgi:hypothetical protein
MAHFSKMVARVAATRKEKAAIKRLIAAVQAEAQQPQVRIYGGVVDNLPELPTIHPYSECWNLVETDPKRWH